MTREEFIERISEIMCGTSNAERACLEELYDEVTKPHWISVKDRKPKLKYSDDTTKYSDTVIVTDGKYRTSACWLYSTWGGWYGWYDDGDEELKGITHWMPMPEAPTIAKNATVKKGDER
jgi:hypothetical protein